MKSLASLGWSFTLIAAAGFLFAIFALAYLAGGLEVVRRWRKRRALHIRAKDLARWNMAAFRGARKFDDPRWPT